MHQLGPDSATLRILTRREGLAARAGHDLVLEVTRWEARLALDDEPSLELTAHPRSIEVRTGSGGPVPLTDRDRRDIRGKIEGKVLGSSTIAFRSTRVEIAGDGRLSVTGDLRLAGATRSASFDVRLGADGAVTGRATVTQSAWGIKPYSGLMGALKVADDVVVEVEGRLPG